MRGFAISESGRAIDVAGDNPEIAAVDAIADRSLRGRDDEVQFAIFNSRGGFIDRAETLDFDRKIAAREHPLAFGGDHRKPIESRGAAANPQNGGI